MMDTANVVSTDKDIIERRTTNVELSSHIPRKASLDSLSSTDSSVTSTKHDYLDKLQEELVQPDGKHSASRSVSDSVDGVGPSSLSKVDDVVPVDSARVPYYTSAKLDEHFPQKILTPIVGSTNTSTNTNTVISTEIVSSSSSISLSDRKDSVSSDQFEVYNSQPSTPKKNSSNENESCSSCIRFLPAYRDRTVEEMMSDLSPRPVWQMNTKYPRNNSDISDMRRSNLQGNYQCHGQGSGSGGPSSSSQYYLNSSPNQYGRQYSHPSSPNAQQHQQTVHPQIKPYSTAIRYRTPSFDVRRANDGTHPRMNGPMRATTPQTYHGVPVHVQNSQPVIRVEPHYGNISMRRDQIYSQSSSHVAVNRPHSYDHHTTPSRTRPRSSNDNSAPHQHLDREMRGSNSETDLHSQFLMRNKYIKPHNVPFNSERETIPSGTYIASSSVTSLPQYAQLMNQSNVHAAQGAQRAASTGNVYQPCNNFQQRYQNRPPHHLDIQATNSPNYNADTYMDSHKASGSRTPTSPVSRQPSYLSAMTAPVRQPRTTTVDDNFTSDVSRRHSDDSQLVIREKSDTPEDVQNKILRRTSYLMATSKPEYSTTESGLDRTPNSAQRSNMRKLKMFFGEKTPSIREAQEKVSQPQTPEIFTLPDSLEVYKAGILVVKIVASDGKRSTDRSWKAMGAALCGQMLYLLKDKKENANVLTSQSGSFSVDEKPISIRACYVDIAHGYTKKRHVFKLITATGSEYMLQAEDHKDMVNWIKAIDENRNPDKESEILSSNELVKRIHEQHQKLNQQQRKRLAGLSFRPKQPGSPSSASKLTDSATKRDDKKPRLSSGQGRAKSLEYGAPAEPIGDFGIPLCECTPSHESEFVPLVVEICTKAIEERGLEFVGVYRVPGNKAGVEMLKSELHKGIINDENEKWKDINVLSSLLKDFLRGLPDSLITTDKYKMFINTNRISNPKDRLIALKRLISTLPDTNFETLKYLSSHLKKVAKYGDINKMDTRNLAIVFGPTIVRSGDDVMSLVTDMSDQCRIIESCIVYADWMFITDDSDPPVISEAEISSSAAPISETMSNISADIAALANKKQSKSQLLSALSSAANRNISKSSLGTSSNNSPSNHAVKSQTQSTNDDHGFKNRDIQQEAATRNQKLMEQKRKESLENVSWVRPMSQPYSAPLASSRRAKNEYQGTYANNLHRWHSEESILAEPTKLIPSYPLTQIHSTYRSHGHIRQLTGSDQSDVTPPPLPARGSDVRPPLPPKPLQLYHAKLARPQSYEPNDLTSIPLYQNFDDFHNKTTWTQNKVQPAKATNRCVGKTVKLPRRGSLDSMMDSYEPYQHCSTSSSTESNDGSDLLSSVTAVFDEKLKMLVNPEYYSSTSYYNRQKLNDGSVSNHSQLSDSSGQNHVYKIGDSVVRCVDIPVSNGSYNNTTRLSEDRKVLDVRFGKANNGCSATQKETKIGIASRIERKDIESNNCRSVMRESSSNNAKNALNEVDDSNVAGSDEEENYFTNNNSLSVDYGEVHLVQRHMSDEKKRIRRRHTVGGVRDYQIFKDTISNEIPKENMFNDSGVSDQQLSAWQRLQPKEEPLSLKDWIERERFRASSPELETNIMHLHNVNTKLSSSLLQTNS